MPTPRQYQFDVDTKRYLNRVNTYRALSGLPDIQKSDAADIDNFVIGLKDLGIWNQSICFLLRSQHNVGAGSRVFSIGGQDNVIGNAVGSPTWSLSGITFSGTNYITAPLGRSIQTSEVSIASVCDSPSPQPGFTAGYPHPVFIGGPSYLTHPYFTIVSLATSGSTWIAGGSQGSSPALNSQTIRMNGGALNSSGVQNYLNGNIATTTTTIQNNLSFDRILICGRWAYNVVECRLGSYGVGWVGTQSFVIVSLDYINFASLQSLIKQTIGKGLGLP